jgi:glutamate synthase domain-containing protein 3
MYKGTPEKVVRLLRVLAREVRDVLKEMGVASLAEITGKNHLLIASARHESLIVERGIDLGRFTKEYNNPEETSTFTREEVSPLNLDIIRTLNDVHEYHIENSDRAVPATLCGLYAGKKPDLPEKVSLCFRGSAGQGFGVFNISQVSLKLSGEANDSVGKGMSGGEIIISSVSGRTLDTLIGNCALYGATGGTLFVAGHAGDRFAVRNSGAHAIVEGTGLHACEYMSGGLVWILGTTKRNLGAGMSGGTIIVQSSALVQMNNDSVMHVPLTSEDEVMLFELGKKYFEETKSVTMRKLLDSHNFREVFVKIIPIKK